MHKSRRLKVEVDRSATDDKEAVEVVARTADWLGGAVKKKTINNGVFSFVEHQPGIAADANDGNGVAGETDLASDRAKNDTEKASKGSNGGAVS